MLNTQYSLRAFTVTLSIDECGFNMAFSLSFPCHWHCGQDLIPSLVHLCIWSLFSHMSSSVHSVLVCLPQCCHPAACSSVPSCLPFRYVSCFGFLFLLLIWTYLSFALCLALSCYFSLLSLVTNFVVFLGLLSFVVQLCLMKLFVPLFPASYVCLCLGPRLAKTIQYNTIKSVKPQMWA